MRGAVLYSPGEVRFEELAAPAIVAPTDAIIKIAQSNPSCRPSIAPSRVAGSAMLACRTASSSMGGLFFAHVHLHGGPAPVRPYLPKLIELAWVRKIDPGKKFDFTLPLEPAAEGYRAMDERRAIKTLLRV
jgi:threonine dehydrogenase-like Zn-dependent dehydrogenase